MPALPIPQSRLQAPSGVVGGRASSPVSEGALVGDAAARFGESVANFGQQLLNEDRADRERKAAEAEQKRAQAEARQKRISAIGQVTQFKTEWNDHVLASRETVAPGAQKYAEQSLTEYDKRMGAILAGETDDDVRLAVQENLTEYRLSAALDANEFEATERANYSVNVVRETTELARNRVRSRPGDLASALKDIYQGIDALPVTEKQKSVLRSGAEKGLGLSAVQGLIEQNPYEAKKKLQSGSFDALLDADAKNALLGSADNAIAQAEQEAARARAEQERAALNFASDIQDRLQRGLPVDASSLVRAQKTFRSMGQTAAADSLAIRSQTLGWLQTQQRATPQALAQSLGTLRQKVAQGSASLADQINLEAGEKLLSAHARMIQTNAHDWAVTTGRAPAAPVLDFSAAPNVLQAQVAQRKAWAESVANQQKVRVPYLSEAEKTMLATRFQSATADQKLGMATQIVTAFGKGDARAIFSSVSKQAPMLALAGNLTSMGRRQTEAASYIFQGQQIVSTDKKLLPGDDKLRAAFNSYAGQAMGMNAQARMEAFEAAKYHYAATAGRFADAGDIDATAFRQSIDAVLGAGDAGGGIAKVNDVMIVLPADVTAQQFRGFMSRADASALKKYSVGGAAPTGSTGKQYQGRDLNRLYPVTIGIGKYAFAENADGSSLVRGSGPNGIYVLDMGAASQAPWPKNSGTVFENDVLLRMGK